MNETNPSAGQAQESTMRKKLDIIDEHERIFANRIAQAIIPTPEVHIWMVLIPVIFVFHFFSLQKASKGRKGFVHNYLITRRKTLEEVHFALEEGRKPDINALADSPDVPDAIRHHYTAWLSVLAEHYAILLRATGGTYEELVKSSYRSRKNYKEALRKLNDAEIRFNGAIKPIMPDDVDGAAGIIEAMEHASVRMRKEQAQAIFA